MKKKFAKFARELERYRYDPVGFCSNVLGMEPHEGQRRWLVNSTKRENILVTGNRWGKSQAAAAKRVWRCVYRKGWTDDVRLRVAGTRQRYRSLILAPSVNQANIVWNKAHGLLQGPKASWLVADVKFAPHPTIEFADLLGNGPLLEARTSHGDGSSLLGESFDDIDWDEAALERKFELIRDNVLRMRLADRAGVLDYTSTGQGRNPFGLYFLSGRAGGKNAETIYTQSGPSFENPYVPREEFDTVAARLGERMRRQNIGGEIVDAGGGFFDIADIEAAISQELSDALVVHQYDEMEWVAHAEVYREGQPWHNAYPLHRYVHFWDIADKQDWAVGRTLDCSGNRMAEVEFERFQHKGWAYVYDRIRDRHHRYAIGNLDDHGHDQSQTVIDKTGVGDIVVENLEDIDAQGFVFSKSSKDEILAGLQSALSLREIEMPLIPVAYDELKFYERDDKALVQDTVMALAGAVHFGRRRSFVYAAAF